MFNNTQYDVRIIRSRKQSFQKITSLTIYIGVVQFLVVTLLAAILYPGGYDFITYYLSDLGSTMTRHGAVNTVSSLLFTLTLIVIAGTLIPFWISISSLFTRSKLEIIISRLGSTLGIFSSPFMIGVALTPMNLNLKLHFTMFLGFFPLFIAASLLYSYLIIRSQYPSSVGMFGLGLFILDIAVLLNPLASYGAILQKVLLYGHFIWVIALTYVIMDKQMRGRL